MTYTFIPSTTSPVPILISVPHCGTAFPDEVKDQFDMTLIQEPDDTDWFVERLYNFAPGMGISMITSYYSRWVIDLNRDPQSKPLYSDGRIITGLCPTTSFLGEPLYQDERVAVENEEVQRRLKLYYQPYHERIQLELHALKLKFGKVLLWDCHSIRQFVKTIQPGKFPDLILGDADGTSASPGLSDLALGELGGGAYSIEHNHPFKGGTITRHFGRPGENQHALQLEMTKVNYMDAAERNYDEEKATAMRNILKGTFEKLIAALAE